MNDYRTARCALRIFTAAAAVCLLTSLVFILQAAGQEKEFNWNQRFSHPAYVYHVTKTHTYSVTNNNDDRYLWHSKTPDSKGWVRDGLGNYKVSTVAGPLHTPRAICEAFEKLDHTKKNGERPPESWAGVAFNCKELTAGKPAAAGKPESESSLGERVRSAAENAAKGAGPGVVVVALVNGIRVLPPLLIRPAKNGRRRKKKKYTLDVRTEDGRTEIYCDGEDLLWIFAKVSCNKPSINTSSITSTINFSVSGPNSDWLDLGKPQYRKGYRAIPARAWPPSPESLLDPGNPTVMVSVKIENHPFQVPVDLTLTHYELEVTPV